MARQRLKVETDLTDEDMTNKKMKTPAQIEKMLGKNREVATVLGPLITEESTGVKLVPEDAKGIAAKSEALEDFA